MNPASAETYFDEVTDFLLSRPTPEEVIAFKPSDDLNSRLHILLDRNKQDALSDMERAELDRFLQLDHLFTILKAKARRKLDGEV